jgi:hypothetical protein
VRALLYLLLLALSLYTIAFPVFRLTTTPQAIQERRKSALTTPDPFFSQVPGLRRLSGASSAADRNTPEKLPSLLDSAVRTVGERLASPTKLGERSASPTKSGERSTSPTKSGERSASPTKALYLSRLASPTKSFHTPAKAFVSLGRSVSPVKAPLTPHSEEDEEDTRSLLDRMKRTVEEIKRRRSVGPFGHDEQEEEDAETADPRQRVVADEDAEDMEEGHQTGEEEENSDKENGHTSPLLPPSSPELEPDVTEISPHTLAPLSPTRIVLDLDLDLELERTPLPQLMRPAGTSRRQHTNAFSGLQTPALTSVKHLFPPPLPVPSTPAVKSMRSLFREAGMSAGLGIREEALDGIEEMMVTPEGYRVRAEDAPEQEIEIEEGQQEQEVSKPARTTSRKTPVPVPASAPTTTAARRRTTRTAVAIGSNSREMSTSRPVSRAETVPSKRTQMVLPKRAGKEKDKVNVMVPESHPQPAPGVFAVGTEDEVTPLFAIPKKPVKVRLLRARKGATAETSVCIFMTDLVES